MLCISEVAEDGFLHILTLIIVLVSSSSRSKLMNVMGGGLIRAFTSAMSQLEDW